MRADPESAHPILAPAINRRRLSRRRLARVLAALTTFVGTLGLLGWILSIPTLRSIVPGLASMKANTAVGLAFCGGAVWSLASWGRHRRTTQLLALVPAILGLGTLAEFSTGRDFGIDEFIVRDRAREALPYFPGRMAPTTAAALTFTGLATALLAGARRRSRLVMATAAQSAVLLVAALSATSVILGVKPAGPVAFHTTQMAIHTSIAFLLLSLAVLSSVPRGPLRLFLVAEDIGGSAARRLIPAAVAIPVLAAALSLAGLGRGWYGPEFVIAALVCASALPAAIAAVLFAERLSLQDRQRRDAAEELIRLNADLERRVAERTADLAAANRELEAFCHSISHDLRSPLLTIDGFGHVIETQEAATLSPAGRDYLARMRSGARRIGAQMEALLELSRLTRSELKREPVDLSAMAQGILGELAEREPSRKVVVIVAPGLTASGDPRLLRIALENLLQNAWKFTSRSEHARIEFRRDTGSPPGEFVVADNGAGFDGTQAGKLFRSFRRLHAAEDFPGHGVGLASAARIIERHGGTISAESSPGNGATFRFTLGANP